MSEPQTSDSGPAWRARRVSGWSIWSLPPHLLFPVLAVDVTALLLVGAYFTVEAVDAHSVGAAVGIVCMAVVHAELARRVEKVRWRITGDLHVDLSSVWTIAGAVLLTPGIAGAVACIVHTYIWLRSARYRAPLYRQIFSTATVVMSCLAASAVISSVKGAAPISFSGPLAVPALVLGSLVFFTVNTALVAGAIAVSAPEARVSQMIGDWDENLLEIATLCLGALVAVAFTVNPVLVVFVFPPLLVLHRAVLVRHLQETASTDGKTGLLNAAAWHTQAERELRRAERREGPRAVLVIDLDHFKAVNDTHGHLAGDRVLAAVADALRGEVRDRDLVGRFGGEEFVVLLGGLGGPRRGHGELEAVAERIRRRIASLRVEMPTADGPLTVAGLSASVGASLYPGDGRDLRTLLQVADTALYAAKRAGRNLVRMGLQPPAPPAAVEHRSAGH